MKRFGPLLVFVLVLGLAMPAVGAEFKINGDFNNRFTVYTDQSGFYSGGEQSNDPSNKIKDDGQSDHWASAKYRLTSTATTNDGAVKGVYGIELGALHYGKAKTTAGASQGGVFSGDGVNIETRLAYTDLQLPFIESKSRLSLGLQQTAVNYYLWNETAMGVQWYGSMDMMDYRLAWTRGFERLREADSGGNSVDSFWGRTDFKPLEGMKLGAFLLFTHSNGATANGSITDDAYEKRSFSQTDLDLNLWELGIDGSYKTDVNSGNLFFEWDAIYQTGDIDDATFTATTLGTTAVQDYDVSAYFLHVAAGYAWDDFKITGRFWYASGDDDETDDDLEGFFATDVDMFTGSMMLMESYDDDNYFTERQYLLDKGMMLAKVAFDWNATDKLKVGAAGVYMLTAEDIEYLDGDGTAGNKKQSEDEVGVELNGYLSYKLYQNVEFAINAGYLFAGDAMDYWEEDSIRDGSSDEDIFRSMARIRYKF
jgi:hypothetical protein